MADEQGPGIGMNKLARILQGRMNRTKDADGALVLDFGTIQGDMSLKTNTFTIPIPRADYHVCRHLTIGPAGGYLAATSVADGHSHSVSIPEKMRKLNPGDRVLVAWVQSEAVVIDIIVRGDSA